MSPSAFSVVGERLLSLFYVFLFELLFPDLFDSAPHRPNPIALSALSVVSVDSKRGIIEVNGLDLLDGTPVLDIKPYVPAFDSFPSARAGWMDEISTDTELARVSGYQTIVSSRGARYSEYWWLTY